MADYAEAWQRRQPPQDEGQQYSGVTILEAFGDDPRTPITGLVGPKHGLINARHKHKHDCGMASVGIYIKDTTFITSAIHEQNYRILADISWQYGRGGGEATIDVTRGSTFTVSGADSINAKVYYAINDITLPFTASRNKQVDCVVQWGGSVNPQKAMLSSEAIHIADTATSNPISIPKCARSMMLMGVPFASLASIVTRFQQDGGGRVQATVNNSFANGCPIGAGFELVSFTNNSGGNIVVIPWWELWL